MLRVALVGYPAAGRSTLFRLMTGAADPRRHGHGAAAVQLGIARVPDPRLDRLAALFKGRSVVPAAVEVADVAAAGPSGATMLVELAPFRNADALVHVVRAFDDPQHPHQAGSIDPVRDARRMADELVLADLAVVEKRLDRLSRDLKKTRAVELEKEYGLLVRCREALELGRPLRELDLAGDDLKRLRGFQFLSAKPLLLVINVGEAGLEGGGDGLDAALAKAGFGESLGPGSTRVVPVCAKIELEIAELDPRDARAFREEMGLHESGLDRVIRASYDLVGYISFFTVGDHECRAWSIPRHSTAVAAAAEVHSDMARGFIRAEVVRVEHLLARGSTSACREHGELRLEGKDYIVQDGDVIYFRFAP